VPTPLRRTIEQRSAPLLLALRRLPGWAPFLLVLALVLAGLFAPAPVGAVLLAVVAVLISWMSYLAWPALAPAERLIRVAVPVLVLVAAVGRILAWV
jgi:hypothetical protein